MLYYAVVLEYAECGGCGTKRELSLLRVTTDNVQRGLWERIEKLSEGVLSSDDQPGMLW